MKGACTGYCYPKIDQDGDKNPPWRNHTLQDIPWGSVLRSGSFLSLIGSVMSPNLRANLWTLLGGCRVRTHVGCSIIPDYPRPFLARYGEFNGHVKKGTTLINPPTLSYLCKPSYSLIPSASCSSHFLRDVAVMPRTNHCVSYCCIPLVSLQVSCRSRL